MKEQFTRRAFLRSSLVGGATLAAATVHAAPAGLYKPGTYSAKASGIGEVIVTMTFDTDKITDVVLDVSNETPSIGQAAAGALRQSLLNAQSAEIDAVSGASITSKAVHQAAAKCIAQAKGEIPVEVITKSAAADENDGDWLGKAPEIAEKDIVDTITTEILVVGCGTGGMFAVAAAAEEGAKVIGIDRYATGTGIRDDLAAIDSRYQKEYGTKIDKFQFINAATMYAGGRLQQKLVRLWCDESGEAIDWYGDRLKERGVELWHEPGKDDAGANWHHFPTGHSPRWRTSDDGTGKPLNGDKVIFDYAKKLGARFDYNTRMVKLEKKDGRVTGCIATNSEGRYVRYNASKGVVVATGGYSRNYGMLRALQPQTLSVIGRNRSMPGALGDGIRACLWAGASMDATHSAMKFDRCAIRPDQTPGEETAKKNDYGMFWMASQPWLKVNADGERFINESGTYENILHSDQYQKGHCHYTLFDSNWKKYVAQFKMHGCSRLVPFENGADPNIPYQVYEKKYLQECLQKGFVKQADTIEDLARQLGLPPEALKATVTRYNKLVADKNDVDFGKEPYRLTPLDTPPFFGAKNTGDILCTMDGIVIDANMNALDEDNYPIPGLYVIGNDSGCYFANTYPNLVTGMACGRTVTFGRHVGKYLAKM